MNIGNKKRSKEEFQQQTRSNGKKGYLNLKGRQLTAQLKEERKLKNSEIYGTPSRQIFKHVQGVPEKTDKG